MNIIYKITYKPHLNTKYPKYYIGSKYNYKGNYWGSVDSKQLFDFSDNIPLRVWWKNKLKTNKEDFVFEILKDCGNLTPKELVHIEYFIHLELDVLSDEYFNSSIATTGFVSIKKHDKTKMLMSKKPKNFGIVQPERKRKID